MHIAASAPQSDLVFCSITEELARELLHFARYEVGTEVDYGWVERGHFVAEDTRQTPDGSLRRSQRPVVFDDGKCPSRDEPEAREGALGGEGLDEVKRAAIDLAVVRFQARSREVFARAHV